MRLREIYDLGHPWFGTLHQCRRRAYGPHRVYKKRVITDRRHRLQTRRHIRDTRIPSFFIIGADVFHEDRIYKIGQNDKEKIMEFAYEQKGQIVTTTIKTRHNAKPKPGTLENTRKKLSTEEKSPPSPPLRRQGVTLNARRSAGQCLIGSHSKPKIVLQRA